MRTLFFIVGCWLTPLVFLLRWSCRIEFVNDPRSALRAANQPFVYAILHAHILYVTIGCQQSDRGTTVVVPNSLRGEMLVPILRALGLVPVRGASGSLGRDRGGGSTLAELASLMKTGNPPLLAIDGPRGPRGDVHLGVGALMQRTGAVAVLFGGEVGQRLILRRWDRMQLPMPFSRSKCHFSESIRQQPGETTQQLCERIQLALADAEQQHDPAEAAAGKIAAERQRKRLAARAANGPDGPNANR